MKHIHYVLVAVIGIAVSVPLISTLAFHSAPVTNEDIKSTIPFYRQMNPRALVTKRIRQRTARRKSIRLEKQRSQEREAQRNPPELKPAATQTGATFWDLSSRERSEIRQMLRRGGCPYNVDPDFTKICLDMLKKQPVKSVRPQQFYRGNF